MALSSMNQWMGSLAGVEEESRGEESGGFIWYLFLRIDEELIFGMAFI